MNQTQEKIDTLGTISRIVKKDKQNFYDANPYPEDRSQWMAHGIKLRDEWAKQEVWLTLEYWALATGKAMLITSNPALAQA
jgi:hypothetical protein